MRSSDSCVCSKSDLRQSSFFLRHFNVMFEREIQRAKELLTQRLAAAQQFIYWQEIRERADIPVFYRNFFGAEAQWWIFEEQLQRAANPRFDYGHEQLALHTVEADRYRMEAARFDHQDLTSAIDLAVKTRFNYILRPRTTLKWFVYRGEPTKTLSEVLLRMDYFLEYDYLLDGFRRWIATKQSEAPTKHAVRQTSLVSVVEFDRTLQNVDNDVILEYSPEEFTDLLTPIYEMFDEIHATDRALQQYRGKVPMPAIIVFLDDKGIYRIAQELEDVMKTRSLRYVGQRDFLHLLNDIVSKLEQETPLPPSLHADTTTLPLDFDDEPIIKADDTIGELALGAAKRTPKPLVQVENAAAEASLPNDDGIFASDSPVSEEHIPEAIKVSILGEAVSDNESSHGIAQEEYFPKLSIDEPTNIHTEGVGGQNEQELPKTFNTELVGLAAMMQEFQMNPATHTEIHDAEYVMVTPDEESTDGAQASSIQPHNNVTTTQESEPTKSNLFSRWSSIFTPRSEE